jgi:hypothetical protein
MVYCPVGAVVACRLMPVLSLVATIVTSGITAPLASVTTPVMVARLVWAWRGGEQQTNATSTINIENFTILIIQLLLFQKLLEWL